MGMGMVFKNLVVAEKDYALARSKIVDGFRPALLDLIECGAQEIDSFLFDR